MPWPPHASPAPEALPPFPRRHGRFEYPAPLIPRPEPRLENRLKWDKNASSFSAGARREPGVEAILGRLGSGGPRGRTPRWARGAGYAARVGTASTGLRNRVPPCSARLGANAADGQLRLAPNAPAASDPPQRRPRSILRPNPTLRKQAEIGRVHTGFLAAGRRLATGEAISAALVAVAREAGIKRHASPARVVTLRPRAA